MSKTENLISGKDAAELLGVSQSYLYKLMKTGRLQRVQLKKSILKSHQPLWFKRRDVEQLLEEASSDTDPHSFQGVVSVA